jgi:adenosine deaminase/adenosine deaminase CECR1
MKLIYTLLFSALLNLSYSQSQPLFEKIRNNEAQLTAFFSQMPRRRLHHHFSGSIYAEPILEDAIAEDFYNTTTMEVLMEKPAAGTGSSAINKRGELGAYKQRIMEKWSIKDYNEVSYPSDKLFFESFESLVQPLWDILEVYWNLRIEQLRKTWFIETEFSTILVISIPVTYWALIRN